MQSLAVVGVAGDLGFPAVRLVDDRAQLVEGQRRLRDEVALLVEPRTVRHVDLDPVRAVIELLARRLARLNRAVNELRAFRDRDLRRVSLEVVAAGGGDRARRGEDARAGNASL